MSEKKESRRNPKVERNIKQKVSKVETVDQDLYGYVSPMLRNLRNKPKKSQADWDQLKDIEAKRREPYKGMQVDTPTLPQPSGQPQLASRNNNPGNVKFRGQTGAVMGDKSFAKFDTPEIGFHAIEKHIRLDKQRDLTLEEYIYKYAPPTDNNRTEEYIQRAMKRFSAQRSIPLKYIPTRELAEFMANQESGTKVTYGGY